MSKYFTKNNSSAQKWVVFFVELVTLLKVEYLI